MKRVYKSKMEPAALRKYRLRYPQETWEHFRRRARGGYRDVKKRILRDQHGLCAYCEISIKLAEKEGEVDDFRVEHYFPKSETKLGEHNYHLDWRNLLGVCHGGSQPYVPDADWRYSVEKYDRTCDVPKGSKPITKRILNPLRIPGNVRIFRYLEHNGRMLVDEETCPKYLQKRAQNTIRELNLNAPRLCRMRMEVVRRLEDEIMQAMANDENLDDVLYELAKTCLLPGYNGMSLPFFSVTRWFLGEAAERIIRTSGKRL